MLGLIVASSSVGCRPAGEGFARRRARVLGTLGGLEDAMKLPARVTICEVGTRDGFQIEPDFIPTEQKVEAANLLAAAGVERIEVTSFVHPKVVPQLADAEAVMAGIRRRPGTRYAALVPNDKGAVRAVDAGVDVILTAMEYGVTHLDASIGGLGGCPFAPGASGNVCTEDLVHCLSAMGIDTGIDLDRLIAASRRVQEIVGRTLPGQIVKAGTFTRRYPVPDTVAARLSAARA